MKQFLVLLGFCVFVALSSTVFAQSTLMAGAASADISPPVGVPLAGYGGGKRRLDFPDLDPNNYNVLLAPSEGILDPLITKVVVIQSGKTKVAIIKMDSIGVMQKMVDDLAKRITSTGIDRDHITMTGTHTHSGPGAMADTIFWAVAAVDLFDKRVYDPFMDRLANLVIKANANLKPARIGVSTGLSFKLSKNRRNHPGVFDPTVGVFKIEDTNGTPMAVLFNFAVHGTCYGSSNMQMSADVSGYAERRIERIMKEKKTPVVAMFINGTEGDVRPAQSKAKGAQVVGHGLGSKVTDILPNIATRDNVTVDVANAELSFDKAHLNLDLFDSKIHSAGEIDCWGMRKFLAKYIPEASWKLKIEVTGLVKMKFRIQALRIGNSVIGCIPGEPLTRLGTQLKTNGGQLGFDNTFVFGLANGHMGYICDHDSFVEGGYEAMLNLYGDKNGGKIMVDTLTKLFKQLKERMGDAK